MISERFPSLSYTFHETFMSAGSDDVKQLSNCHLQGGRKSRQKALDRKKNRDCYINRSVVINTPKLLFRLCCIIGATVFRKAIVFDTHGSVHRRLLSRNTNKLQLCNRIYYSKVFLKAQHVSSGTPLIIRSSKLYLQPLHSIL